MKKILLSFALLCCSLVAFADPHDCMSKEEAELLAKKILNQYIMDYCDCCEANNAQADPVAVSPKLLRINKVTVVTCSYDAERYAVEVTYTFLGAYNAKDGKLTAKNAIKQINKQMRIAKNASLNYHFYLNDAGKAERLYGLLGKEAEYGTCWGLDRFPTAKEVEDKDYKKFIATKKK